MRKVPWIEIGIIVVFLSLFALYMMNTSKQYDESHSERNV